MAIAYEDVSIKLEREGTIDVSDTVNRGGIIVGLRNSVKLYGNVHHAYALSQSIPVSKFTRFRFLFTEVEVILGVGFCLFQDYGNFLVEEVTYCVVLKGGYVPNSSNFVMVRSGSDELNGKSLNLALRRSTSQSSVTGQTSVKAPGDSNFAVDGNVNQIFSNDAWQFNTVTRTELEVQPFWVVDLGEDTIIRQIVIYKRMDVYEDDLTDFTISIRDSNDIETASIDVNGIANAISEYEFDSVLGKTVRIALNGNYKRVLCLAEVQVYGAVFEFDLPIGKLFNFPEMVINRFAFIQDRSENTVGNRDLEFESTIFANMVLSSDNIQSGAQSAVVSFDILRCLYIA